MIRAIGLDVVQVDRIERAMQRPGFLDRVLTPAEAAHCRTPQQVAGRWAAKEAMMKCLPGELTTFRQIEILPGVHGEPVVAKPSGGWMLSITHEKGLAAAVALLTNDPGS